MTASKPSTALNRRRFVPVLARCLATHGPTPVAIAIEAVADACKLNAAQKLEMSDSNAWEPKYRNVIRWARQDLNFAGLLDRSVGRGIWALNENGRKLLARFKKDDDAFVRAVYELHSEDGVELAPTSQSLLPVGNTDTTPDDAVVHAVTLYETYIKNLLREELADVSATRFEHIAADVLARSLRAVDQSVTPPSRDGGIDGTLYLDHLRLHRAVFQAKKYDPSAKVSRTDIDAFYAAARRENASAMVFITTARFSNEALTAARTFGIRTIAGDELVSLMLRVGVGVRERQTFTLHSIDAAYFSEDP
ncbi:restriction endonuclease [Sorangium sp. So ce1000]|uniref:restriction endonuclease n=1 Tax=Sorangium sp. So ce1000 TaxID=3133325 RepID=UPI003F5D7B7F